MLCSRFAAGLRISIPLVCATAGMPAKKYSTLNLISGFAWASFWVAVTYQIGAAHSLRPLIVILSGLVLLGTLGGGYFYLHKRRRRLTVS